MRFSPSKIRLAFGALLILAVLVVPFAVSDRKSGASRALQYAPGPAEIDSLNAVEQYWTDRVTYPTGRFDQRWLLQAAQQDKAVRSAVPAGQKSYRPASDAPLALNPNAFTSLGPAPQDSETCQDPCYTFGLVSGRVNAIVIDTATTTPGQMVAYIAPVGGGVWKSSNCCIPATTWTVVSDTPLVTTTSIDDLYIDPANRWVYAATGDLNFGSFAMGSAGILRSKDLGVTWEVLGANVFTPIYPPALTPTFPQYQAIGKVRVDPNNSNTIIAGTKTGLFFSYDSGANWSGPCLTNAFSSQRQDITGLLSRDNGTTTSLYAAVGTRGYATTVQPDLGGNGANGIYSMTIPASPSGCPAVGGWTLLNTGWPANTGSGVPCGSVPPSTSACTGNSLGRIDLAMAPSNPNVIYAEVQAPAPQPGTCRGCFLGLWRTTDGGATWALRSDGTDLNADPCGANSAQNWYNQALAVDPNNPDAIFLDEIDIWKSTDGGTTLTDITCGYTLGLAGNATHVDQHALTFLPGSSTSMLAGNDGGIYLTLDANAPVPTFTNLNATMNTIEFYSGDISANFANSSTPFIVAGAQDNGSSAYQWAGDPGPAVWQQRNGGDGMFARIEPKQGLNIYMESQWGAIVRSTTGPYGALLGAAGPWGGGATGTGIDTKSFIFPYEIDKHVCKSFAGVDEATCGHMIAGTRRVWETINGGTWLANSPDLTKGVLLDRSFIGNLAYAYTDNKIAIAGTNDGNVQYGFGLGQGITNTATWVNVTGGNAVLPNRPILDVTIKANNALVGYAAVGGFDENTPATPGHVFQVTCTATCGSSTWLNKSGNLPNIPVDSIAVNPKVPNQIFAGTDWGLYFTNDISVANPLWFRFSAGLPPVMIWDMAIDRGPGTQPDATTLALFTRGRGAYAWPLPTGPITPTAVQVRSFSARAARRGVTLSWRTAAEVDTLGFNVWRFANGKGLKVNRSLVAAKRRAGGATYRLVDRHARPGASYTYRLQAVSTTGTRAWHGRTTVRAQR